MDAAALSNLLAYSLQLACIVALASMLPPLVRLDAPGVRYAYWRVVAALCLLLPWLQGRHAPVDSAGIASVTTGASAATAVATRATATGNAIDWLTIALFVLAAGIVVRLIWIAAGLVQLRRLRTVGAAAPASDVADELQRVIGTHAEIRYVPGLGQPVTFGAIRPVVLLPDTLLDQPSDMQRAVLGHELFHVQRRDWVWILAEELVCASLWFNPAVWWLISRVQLAREEVVDELAVLLTGRRRTYVEALLAFADRTPLAPAPAFARRRHLFRRVMLISREVAMSSQRIVASCAMMALVVAAGSWYAVSAFPMQQATGAVSVLASKPGPLEMRANAITPENPVPKRNYYVAPAYPPEGAALDARGTVSLKLTLDEGGRVAEARATAISWRGTTIDGPLSFSFSGDLLRNMDGFQRTMGTSGSGFGGARDSAVAFITAAIDTVGQWRYEPPANPPISFTVAMNFAPEGMPPTPPAGSFNTEGALRVGGTIRQPIKTHDVRPVYPPLAQEARVSGVVIVEARIEGDGRVSQARVLRSIPLLDQAALEAVMQWQFTPTLMNGAPVPIIMTVTVNFTLQ